MGGILTAPTSAPTSKNESAKAPALPSCHQSVRFDQTVGYTGDIHNPPPRPNLLTQIYMEAKGDDANYVNLYDDGFRLSQDWKLVVDKSEDNIQLFLRWYANNELFKSINLDITDNSSNNMFAHKTIDGNCFTLSFQLVESNEDIICSVKIKQHKYETNSESSTKFYIIRAQAELC